VTTYAYACPVPDVATADEQLDRIRGTGVTPAEEFRDGGDTTWRVPLRDRAGGKRLLARLAPGDVVVVGTPLAASNTLSGYINLAAGLHELGSELRLAGSVPTKRGPLSRRLQSIADEALPSGSLGALPKADQIRIGLQYARAARRKTSRYPPIGHKHVRRGRNWYVSIDRHELRVIALIVKWRNERKGSWGAIARHLLKHGVKTSANLDWTVRRIRRAYDLAVSGELELPPAEQPQPAATEATPAPGGAQ
jgi:hypothetical protein